MLLHQWTGVCIGRFIIAYDAEVAATEAMDRMKFLPLFRLATADAHWFETVLLLTGGVKSQVEDCQRDHPTLIFHA
jgi:hypothetical protein